MIVLDTGPLVAAANPRDAQHARAVALVERALGGAHGHAVTTDYVLDEALTLAQARRVPARVVKDLLALLEGGDAPERAIGFVLTGEEAFSAALDDFLAGYPGRLSFTDWTLVHTARRMRAAVLTFDAALAKEARTARGRGT